MVVWPIVLAAMAAMSAGQTPVSGAPQRGSEPCEYEENCQCAVPGITVRWKAAYCMLVNATDDLEQAGVSACLARPDPESVARADACAQNAYWKERFCAHRHEGDEDAARACAEDPKMIPPVVKKGGGGDEPRRPLRD